MLLVWQLITNFKNFKLFGLLVNIKLLQVSTRFALKFWLHFSSENTEETFFTDLYIFFQSYIIPMDVSTTPVLVLICLVEISHLKVQRYSDLIF